MLRLLPHLPPRLGPLSRPSRFRPVLSFRPGPRPYSAGAKVKAGIAKGSGPAVVDRSDLMGDGRRVLGEFARHLWPKGQPALKARVVAALGLLFTAKARNSYHIIEMIIIYYFLLSAAQCHYFSPC